MPPLVQCPTGADRYYSLFTLGMLVMFECTVVAQRLRNLKELRTLSTPKQAIQVRFVSFKEFHDGGNTALCTAHALHLDSELCAGISTRNPLQIALGCWRQTHTISRFVRQFAAWCFPCMAAQVYRQGKWDKVPGDALLPGDIISIGRPQGACSRQIYVIRC